MLEKLYREIDSGEKQISEALKTLRDFKLNMRASDYEPYSVAEKQLRAARIHIYDARRAIKTLWSLYR